VIQNLKCEYCRTIGHESPHFWRYQSVLRIHCHDCCDKAYRFAHARNADFSPKSHFIYGGLDKYPHEKIVTNKKSKKVWPGALSVRLTYEDAEPTYRVKEYNESC